MRQVQRKSGGAVLAILAIALVAACDGGGQGDDVRSELRASTGQLESLAGFQMVLPSYLPEGISPSSADATYVEEFHWIILSIPAASPHQSPVEEPTISLVTIAEGQDPDPEGCPLEVEYVDSRYSCDETTIRDHIVALETVPLGETEIAFDGHFRSDSLYITVSVAWTLPTGSPFATEQMRNETRRIIESMI